MGFPHPSNTKVVPVDFNLPSGDLTVLRSLYMERPDSRRKDRRKRLQQKEDTIVLGLLRDQNAANQDDTRIPNTADGGTCGHMTSRGLAGK